jgi:uncharacterized pyridoxal phosphate-containing UPF0001 family protein
MVPKDARDGSLKDPPINGHYRLMANFIGPLQRRKLAAVAQAVLLSGK